MTKKRFGKSSASLLNQKKSFFSENKHHVKKQRKIAQLYKKQPKRICCVNCNKKLRLIPDFVKDSIGYIICENCHHLNGEYEKTDELCDALYAENSGEEYAENYHSKDVEAYNYRTASIYIPKAEFLHTSLKEKNINPHDLDYFDFGAGSGYFVSALKKIGLKNLTGTDVSKYQVEFGNAMIGENILSTHTVEETTSIIRNISSKVVSMVDVLEHLKSPRDVLLELKNNKHVDFLFVSVPTFSLSVYLEMISPDVFHRQLDGDHTHLFTKKSLSYLFKDFSFDILAEWWFGTDIVDLFRHISVLMEKIQCSKKLMDLWKKDFIPIIDGMQLEIDKNQFSSQVHMILKRVK